jgi:hypothetical protein
VLITLSVAMLVGCASTAEISAETGGIVEAQWRLLDATETCCAEYQEADFLTLTDEGAEIFLEPGRVRAFDSGKSYFQGVKLGALKGAPTFVVKSHQNFPRRNGLPYVVRPSYVVVDSQFEEVSKVVDIPLCYAQGWGQKETGYFGVVKPVQPDAWGVVIHTSSTSRGTYVEYGNEATTAGGNSVVTVSVDYSFPASPVGKLEILPLTADLRVYLEKKCPELLK